MPANVYDGLPTYPVDDIEDLRGQVAEDWEIADERQPPRFRR